MAIKNIDKNNLFFDDETKSFKYKDLAYYSTKWFIFGAFYALVKEIFSDSPERKWIRKYEQDNK